MIIKYMPLGGLGAGLRTNKETGGEPGCTRCADGIWLYQYAVESIIRNSTKQRSMEWMRINNRIGSNASIHTPLHRIGEYNMFTQQEWDDQVRDLLKHCGIIHLKPIHSHLWKRLWRRCILDSLRRLHGCEEVKGNDQVSACVDIASSRLLNGKIWVGDAADLSRVPSAMVWLVTWTSRIMLREPSAATSDIAKSGGTVLIAEHNVLVSKSRIGLRRGTHSFQ